MKKITIFVDDDVERIDIFPADVFSPGRYEKIIPNVRKEGYINQKLAGINIYRDEKKSAFIEAIYPAISIDDNVEKPNQKAIECLKELERDIREIIDSRYVDVGGSQATLYVDYVATLGLIDNKIKELEEEK